MFNQDPPDSSYITGQRNMDRTWGNNINHQPPNLLSRPLPEQLLDDDLKPQIPQFNDLVSPSDVIQVNNNNVPFSQFVHQLNNKNFPDTNLTQYSNQPQKQLQPQYLLLEQRDSMLSILSNLLYNKLYNHMSDKYNYILSPFSLYYVLLSLLVGARGNTFNELGTLLGMVKSDILPALITESIKLQRELINHEGVNIRISNGFFIDNDFKDSIIPKYNEFMKKVGKTYIVNFNQPSYATSRMNDWVSDITRGLIKDLMKPSDIIPNTMMVLINVIYFKANWKNQFNKMATSSQNFSKSTGLKVRVPLMYQKSKHYYFEDGQFKVLTLSYQNPNFVMDVILPNNKTENFPVANLQQFLEIYNNHQMNQEVEIYLPKFKQQNQINLKPILKRLGVNKLFNKNTSDLLNIGIKNGNNLYVSKIIQEAVIIVDEVGTEAVAATMSMVNSLGTSKSLVFRADRTFQYTIRYVPTNTILFTGVYDG